jgi:HEAT repeat protein
MLGNSSATERMKAVQFARELAAPDGAVLNALVRTVNDDPNVNVRLLAVEALALYTDHPEVREALVQAIVRQDSPLVQLALADVMLALNEKRAVEPIRRLIASPRVDYAVKSRLEAAVRQLL